MTPEQIEAVRQRVVADRRAQGLADHVTDPAVLRRVAGLVLGTQETPAGWAGVSTSHSPSTSPDPHPASPRQEDRDSS